MKSAATLIATAPARRRRLSTHEREEQILAGAVAFFAEHGLDAQTRDLAKALGITHPLLFHYFPTKQALIERVYERVYLGRWKHEWEQWIVDPSLPFEARLCRFYCDYARTALTRDWVRILLFSGLKDGYIPHKYLGVLRERIFPLIVRETRAYLDLPPRVVPTEEEMEHLWGLHGGIFHLGVRIRVYHEPEPADLDAVVRQRVHAFIVAAADLFLP
jgi:AcrR family transcriptional regulator